MNISTVEQAREIIETWRSKSDIQQCRDLSGAIESLELGYMYYEQKGNEKGLARLAQCIEILQARLGEISV